MSAPPPLPRPRDAAPPLLPLLAGGALLLLAGRRRGAAGALAAAGGAGLVAAALTPTARRAVVRAGSARAAADVHTSVIVERPVREAFAFCADFENFPSVTGALESVVDYGDGRSRWTLRTRDGDLLEWSAIVTKFVPGQVLAWESVPGGPVSSTGLVRFTPLGAARTRLDIHVTFRLARLSVVDAARALLRPRTSATLGAALEHVGRLLDAWDAAAEPDPPEPLVPHREQHRVDA